MKKLVLVFTVVLLTAISSNVFGQNSGTTPTPGTNHDYWVNATNESSQTSGIGNNFAWWISIDGSNLDNAELESNVDFTITGGAYGTTPTEDNFTIGITWNLTSVGKTFYLVVEEVDATGCSNKKAIAVQPQSNFALQFVALASDGTTEGDNLSRCAPDIALSATGTTITYNYGDADYMFKLIATDVYTGWSFANAFDNSLDGATAAIQYQVGGTSGTWEDITTPVSVAANSAGTEEVYVRVNVNNGTAVEGTSGQSIELTLSDVKDSNDTAVTEITNALDADITASPVQLQTVTARPATTTIGSN